MYELRGIMKPVRKTYTPEFKVQVVLEAMTEQQPMAAVARKFGVAPSLVARWKKRALTQLRQAFVTEETVAELRQELAGLDEEYRWLKAKYDGYLGAAGEGPKAGRK
jgi:transposase-like protein